MQEYIDEARELLKKIKQAQKISGISQKKDELASLEGKMNQPAFWNNSQQAAKISKKAAELDEEIKDWENLKTQTEELIALALESQQEDGALFTEIRNRLDVLKKRYGQFELDLFLSDKYDKYNAILSIYAGAGGTDAQDWAQMLERMYLKFTENKNFKSTIIDRQTSQEAGIKSTTLSIKGRYAYGYLKGETGVHRLVRISPFDAERMRHTSFAMVEVLPELEEGHNIEIKDEDIKIDTFKSSGHGGQSVNTTDSAVRIKHLPTGIRVTCQNERSQLQNKETAFKILKSKLEQYQQVEQEEERQRLRGEFTDAAWGNQIRSYVLHPYKMVKDHHTNYEVQDVESVLDGDLDNFIENYLKGHKIKK